MGGQGVVLVVTCVVVVKDDDAVDEVDSPGMVS